MGKFVYWNERKLQKGVVMCVCNPNTCEAETGRSLGYIATQPDPVSLGGEGGERGGTGTKKKERKLQPIVFDLTKISDLFPGPSSLGFYAHTFCEFSCCFSDGAFSATGRRTLSMTFKKVVLLVLSVLFFFNFSYSIHSGTYLLTILAAKNNNSQVGILYFNSYS